MEKQILRQLSNLESYLKQNEKPLTLNEASEYLDLSESYVYKLTHSNQIPFYKPNGKKLYFLKSELNKWMLRNRKKTIDELEQDAINNVSLGNNHD